MCVGLERKKSGAFNPMVSTDGIVYRDRTLPLYKFWKSDLDGIGVDVA